MNITELKNKLEEIPLEDIFELIDELNKKFNNVWDMIYRVIEEIEEIDKQNKLNFLSDYERTKPRIRNNNHIKRKI